LVDPSRGVIEGVCRAWVMQSRNYGVEEGEGRGLEELVEGEVALVGAEERVVDEDGEGFLEVLHVCELFRVGAYEYKGNGGLRSTVVGPE
jgi:hypothetical protein